MEFLQGGELYDRVCELTHYDENVRCESSLTLSSGFISECPFPLLLSLLSSFNRCVAQTTRLIARQLIEAVAYLHDKNVAHRDIKPENILLARPKDESEIKLTDFGFASEFNPKARFAATCGTPLYVAPEIISLIPYDTRWCVPPCLSRCLFVCICMCVRLCVCMCVCAIPLFAFTASLEFYLSVSKIFFVCVFVELCTWQRYVECRGCGVRAVVWVPSILW